VVLLRAKERTRLSRQEEVAFRALVKAAFAHRRKTLVNSLKDEGYDQTQVTDALISLSLSPIARAEILSVAQFIELTRRMPSSK
jgi:16S rRNA (adenine1518-N6/adenine1519-N6)-dimethyltransferase